MPHRTDHVVHQLKAFLEAPLPGGGKRWHVAALCALSFIFGLFF
jgi:hypothetical protein